MAELRRPESSRKLSKTQVAPIIRIGASRAPQQGHELLNGLEIKARFGLYEQQLYAAATSGLLHPVRQRGGRRLYYLDYEVAALASELETVDFETLLARGFLLLTEEEAA